MTELRNTEHELSRFRLRVAAALFVLFAFGLLGARLVYLQIYKHEDLSTQAENNRIRKRASSCSMFFSTVMKQTLRRSQRPILIRIGRAPLRREQEPGRDRPE